MAFSAENRAFPSRKVGRLQTFEGIARPSISAPWTRVPPHPRMPRTRLASRLPRNERDEAGLVRREQPGAWSTPTAPLTRAFCSLRKLVRMTWRKGQETSPGESARSGTTRKQMFSHKAMEQWRRPPVLVVLPGLIDRLRAVYCHTT